MTVREGREGATATGTAAPVRSAPGPVGLAPPPGRRVPRFSLGGLLAALALELAALASLGLVRSFLSATLGLRLDHAEIAAVVASHALAFGAGWAATALTKRVGFWEILAAAGAVIGAGYGLFLFPGAADATFAVIPEGARIFAPAFAGLGILLVSSVGATMGFMLGAGVGLDLSFGYEAYVAKSHLRLSRKLLAGLSLLVLGIVPGLAAIAVLLRRQKRSPTLIMTVISIGGVAVGVMALTVVLSVMSGFETDLKRKILGTNAHAIVLKYGAFDEWKEAAQTAEETPGVVGVTPFVLNEVMVTTETNLAGALIKGIDVATVGRVTELPREIQEGKLEWLDAPGEIPVLPAYDARGMGRGELDELQKSIEELVERKGDGPARLGGAAPPPEQNELPGLVLGRELARQLRVFVGDPVTVVSPIAGEIGPMGPQPKSMQFRVAAVFYSGMYEYDSKFVYIALPTAQRFFKMGRSVTGLELKVDEIDDARRISRSVLTGLEGYPFRVKDWGEMNRNLFSALKLEKIVMGVILAFIVLVACFNILSTLVMLVLEKSKEISILKSMGAKDASVMKVFVLEGLAIGGIGTVLGLVLGFLLCLTIRIFPIPLDPEVYYIPHLPVQIEPVQFALVGILAVVLAYLATILPALYASRLSPVEGLRNE